MTTLLRLTSIPWLPHLVLTVLLAAVLGVVGALLERRGRRNRVYYAIWIFSTWTAVVIAGSWVMFLIHG
jgi:hypothetical protein